MADITVTTTNGATRVVTDTLGAAASAQAAATSATAAATSATAAATSATTAATSATAAANSATAAATSETNAASSASAAATSATNAAASETNGASSASAASTSATNAASSATSAATSATNSANSATASAASAAAAALYPSSVADGSAAAPSIAFAIDTDSGLYRVGANNIGVAVGGTKMLDIATGGLTVSAALVATGVIRCGDGADHGFGDGSTRFSGSAASQYIQAIINSANVCTFSPASVAPIGLLDLSNASSGQIKFPATQNASSNANTLDDYEEGTWTPADVSGAGLSLTVASATYTKVGREVFIKAYLTFPATANGAQAQIGGLPFTVGSNQYAPMAVSSNSGVSLALHAEAVGTKLSAYNPDDYLTTRINSDLSGKGIVLSGTYCVD